MEKKDLKNWNYLEVGALRCEIDVSKHVLSSWRKLAAWRKNQLNGRRKGGAGVPGFGHPCSPAAALSVVG